MGSTKHTQGRPGAGSSGRGALRASEVEALEAAIRRLTGSAPGPARRARVLAELVERLGRPGAPGFEAFLASVERPGSERDWLVSVATVHRTAFFREPEPLERLGHELLGQWAAAGARTLRLWSAGCATGEEAYTLALALVGPAQRLGIELSVLGTDIDAHSLARAREGIYPEESLRSVAPELAERWFLKGTGRWAGHVRVRSELRRRVRFERLNLVEDHWHTGGPFDAILCRNVSIYFDRRTGERVFGRFHAELAPRGWLIVGAAEDAERLPERFEPLGLSTYRRIEPLAPRRAG